jgi:hypothetical protein
MYNNGNSSKNVTGASVVDGTLENADFADNTISGDKIDAGIISNFQSTGIDDRLPTGKVLTLSDSDTVLDTKLRIKTTGDGDSYTGGAVRIFDNTGGTNVLALGQTVAGGYCISQTAISNGGNYYYQVFRASGSTVGSITSNGSSISYNTSSDYRLKENVVPMTGSIDRLKSLKPSKFNFKADSTTTVDGFLAHEAGSVVPECMSGEKDAVDAEGNPDYQGIDQSKLVPLLVSALQEAITRIEQLENI